MSINDNDIVLFKKNTNQVMDLGKVFPLKGKSKHDMHRYQRDGLVL
jgi:hypothetical protein